MSASDFSDIPRGKYRHFKGNLYELIDVARDSETEQPMAIYRTLYGDHSLWVRPLAMFLETIERNDKEIQRFQYVGDQPAAESL